MKYMNYYFVLSLFLMGYSGDSYLPMLLDLFIHLFIFINGGKCLHGSISFDKIVFEGYLVDYT
jgi:hypothetical protein